jgi:hypothetical protein
MKQPGQRNSLITWVTLGICLLPFAGEGEEKPRGLVASTAAIGQGVSSLEGAAVQARPQILASLVGSYRSSNQHPRVFMTPETISNLVARANSPGSFSAQNFSQLANQIKADLAANVDWDAAYSGCDLGVYLRSFSYEPTTVSANGAHAKMRLKEGMKPPAGAAVIASRLALYAVLTKKGVRATPGQPSANEAAALSKRILLAWATTGFRDQNEKFLHSATQFCEANGTVSRGVLASVGLQVGRGMIYSTHAQDLLESIAAFSSSQTNELNVFHNAMFNLIREASNFRAGMREMNGPEICERYSNHVGAHLLGMMSIARLFDDPQKLKAVLYGDDHSVAIAIPWTAWFDHAVYGLNDKPIGCHKNTGRDSLSSHPFFETNMVAPGEILDRYRNENPAQAFGYTTGVLGGCTIWRKSWKTPVLTAIATAGRTNSRLRWQHSTMPATANMLASESQLLPIMGAPV